MSEFTQILERTQTSDSQSDDGSPPEQVELNCQWYRKFRDVSAVAYLVALEESAVNDHNQNIPRYVEPKNDQAVLTVDAALKKLRANDKKAFAAEKKLIGILKREELLK